MDGEREKERESRKSALSARLQDDIDDIDDDTLKGGYKTGTSMELKPFPLNLS